jgi:predicted membrane protein
MKPQPINYQNYGLLYAAWARWVSLAMASLLSVAILAAPQLIATDTADLRHGSLSLSMIGMAAGFVHGVGYVPVMTVWRLLFSPYLGWPIMLSSGYFWFWPLLSH